MAQNIAGNLEAGSSDLNKADVENMNGTVNGTALDKPKSNIKSSDEESDQNGEYESLSYEDVIVDSSFHKLIEKMRLLHYSIYYSTEDEQNGSLDNVIDKCRLLFERDYKVVIVKNEICDNYSKKIVIPVAKKDDKNEVNAVSFNAEEYMNLVVDSQEARLRSRFVVPAILFDNKFICRSGTLTVLLSATYQRIRSSMPTIEGVVEAVTNPSRSFTNTVCKVGELAYESIQWLMGADLMELLFLKDERVLRHLGVEHICDLMIEYNKHFKQAVYVSSTEKVYEKVYKDVKMEEMPYPGCEFFTEYSEAGRKPEGLSFDWSHEDATRTLELAEDPKIFFPDMDIENSKEWDLVKLTQNYLKIMLSYLVTGTGGLLVHCISGWDRTPLFVSLIRLSLWADGLIHQSLNYDEMAYLTVAYDWFLFGHNLPNRLAKKEEVMHFCFNFLMYITSDEYSVTRMFKELPPEQKRDRTFSEFVPGRRECLHKIRNYILDFYETLITSRSESE